MYHQTPEGRTVCTTPRNSVLFDGLMPHGPGTTGQKDWAAELLVLRLFNPIKIDFAFKTAVTVTRVEVTMFNCPTWLTGPSFIRFLTPPSIVFGTLATNAIISCRQIVTACLTVNTTESFVYSLQFIPQHQGGTSYLHLSDIKFFDSAPPCPTPPPPPPTGSHSSVVASPAITSRQGGSASISATCTLILLILLLLVACLLAVIAVLILWRCYRSQKRFPDQFSSRAQGQRPSNYLQGQQQQPSINYRPQQLQPQSQQPHQPNNNYQSQQQQPDNYQSQQQLQPNYPPSLHPDYPPLVHELPQVLEPHEQDSHDGEQF